MLQNQKYIGFADDNTVEVMVMDGVKGAVAAGKDKRAELYEAKDQDGRPVKYLKEFAGMTVEQIEALNSSPAKEYNKTQSIPYVTIVDPYTLKEIKRLPGGTAGAKELMDEVLEAKKELNAAHGPSLRRSVLQKYEAGAKEVEAALAKGGAAKALTDFRKIEAAIAKEPDSLKARAKKLEESVLAAAKAQLDDAEKKIAAGDLKGAGAILGPLAKALKGTADLEARANDLLAKATPK